MQIRVQRTVNVLPYQQNRFFELALRGIERFREENGIEPDLFVNLQSTERPVDVRFFIDFESMAQYETIFLHKTLHDDSYLDMPETAVDMIYDQPCDEMYVRMDLEDHFMNRKGDKVIATSDLDLSRDAKLNKTVATYRIEREYRASKGRLRDTMRTSFEFMHSIYKSTGHAGDLFCTRFSPLRIGSVKLYFDSNDFPQSGPAFLQQDQELATGHHDLLQGPPITKVYQRIQPQTVKFDFRASGAAPTEASP